MKKILYVVSTLRTCGPINQLYGIVSNLDSSKYEACILTLSPEPENSSVEKFQELDVKVDTLKLSRSKSLFKGSKILKDYILQYKPDIIHTTGVRVDSMVSSIEINDYNLASKQVMSIRNYAEEDYISKFGTTIGKIFTSLTYKTIEKVHFPVCCSYTLREKYKNKLNKNMLVIQNGVNTNNFRPPKSYNEKINIRKKLNLPLDKKLYIAVGSLIDRKNPLLMLEAFKEAQLGNSMFVILGDGPLKNKMETNLTNDIIMLGNVDNVSDYLLASDIYVSASKSEGLPNSVLEASGVGLGLVLSNIPQHIEIFMHTDVKFSHLFELDSKEDLIKQLKNVNSKTSINYKLSEYIKKYFSTKRMSKDYQTIYKNIK